MGIIGTTAQTIIPESEEHRPAFLRNFLPECFVWEPSASVAAEFALLTRQFWQYNAGQALQSAAVGHGMTLHKLQRDVEHIDLSRSLAPRLCARLSSLMQSVEHRDGYAVYDALQTWSCDPPESWYSDHLLIESIAIHAWENDVLREVRSTQIPGVSGLELFPLLERDITGLQAAMRESLERVAVADPDMHAEIESHVSLVQLCTGNGIKGLSTPRAFGAIWLQAPNMQKAQYRFPEDLVHECSHLHLNAILIADSLLTNPQEVNRSPLRPAPRPMIQILHGTFVLARNCRVHARLSRQYPELRLEAAREKFAEQFRSGMQVLNDHMQPTNKGTVLLNSLNRALSELN
jgi:hypothetical protein